MYAEAVIGAAALFPKIAGWNGSPNQIAIVAAIAGGALLFVALLFAAFRSRSIVLKKSRSIEDVAYHLARIADALEAFKLMAARAERAEHKDATQTAPVEANGTPAPNVRERVWQSMFGR